MLLLGAVGGALPWWAGWSHPQGIRTPHLLKVKEMWPEIAYLKSRNKRKREVKQTNPRQVHKKIDG